MKCTEAQLKIFAFIDDKLSLEENIELIDHIKNCRECKEELEINYALITAFREDDTALDSEDYSSKLKKKIYAIEQEFRRKLLRIKWKKALLIAVLVAAGLLMK